MEPAPATPAPPAAPQSPALLSYRRAEQSADAPDNCYRCGYPLLGIGDEQACPECGLLARRSRRTTDELHNTRPRWLARISRGANLILLAIVIAAVWPFAQDAVESLLYRLYGWMIVNSILFRLAVQTGYLMAAGAAFAGIWLLASAERYPPADRGDRRLRKWLRVAAVAPVLVALLYLAGPRLIAEVLSEAVFSRWRSYRAYGVVLMLMPVVSALACAPLPLLLFARLRGLGQRARSAHLMEHCTIVGIGASAALLFCAGLVVLSENDETLGLGQHWIGRSNLALALVTLLATAATLFTLWSLYLFVRFAHAFRSAARELRGRWTSDDRSLAPQSPTPPTPTLAP